MTNAMRSAALVLAAVLGACGGARPAPVDEASAGEASAGEAADRNSCAQDISLACDSGFIDGCLQKGTGNDPLTLVHVCVAESETAGPPCAQEIARKCPDGQQDACLMAPPAATRHVCVLPVEIP
jgi:hypothetical protein